MTRRLTPIEMMVDAACGLRAGQTPPTAERPEIRLRCPVCGETVAGSRQPQDPADATVLEVRCPKCAEGDFWDGTGGYLNEAGRIVAAWKGWEH